MEAKHLKNLSPELRASNTVTYKNNPWLISIYASVILYMGPGSMFFHGAMTTWGGMMDVISMYAFVLFVIAYLIYRIWQLSIRSFYFIYFS